VRHRKRIVLTTPSIFSLGRSQEAWSFTPTLEIQTSALAPFHSPEEPIKPHMASVQGMKRRLVYLYHPKEFSRGDSPGSRHLVSL